MDNIMGHSAGGGGVKPTTAPAFLYLHIFKTGGTSMLFMLDSIFPAGQSCPVRTWPDLRRVPKVDLQRYQLFRGHFGGDVSGFLGRPLREFTLLRHPVARCVSQYRFIARTPGRYQQRFQELGSLGACLQDPEVGKLFTNLQARFIADDRSTGSGPLHPEWVGDDTELQAKALRRLDRMECVGVLERFAEFVHLVCEVYEWGPPARHLLLNSDPERQSGPPVSEADRDLILSLNAVDLALFEYADRRMNEIAGGLERMRREHPEAWVQHMERRIADMERKRLEQAEQIAHLKAMLETSGGRIGMALQRMADRILAPDSRGRALVKPVGDAVRKLVGWSRES